MRAVFAVLLGIALCVWVSPVRADEATDPAVLPPQSVSLPTPIEAEVQNAVDHQHSPPEEDFSCVGNIPAEDVVDCLPSKVDTGRKIAKNNAKIATSFRSPAPPAGVGKKIDVNAYAYCINGRTASGARTKLGTVAVDRNLIPLGSKIYIPGYGWGTAQDTGGHMRGKTIDIWYPSFSECMNWGVRKVTITVLPK